MLTARDQERLRGAQERLDAVSRDWERATDERRAIVQDVLSGDATQVEVAAVLGVGKARVGQIVKAAPSAAL